MEYSFRKMNKPTTMCVYVRLLEILENFAHWIIFLFLQRKLNCITEFMAFYLGHRWLCYGGHEVKRLKNGNRPSSGLQFNQSWASSVESNHDETENEDSEWGSTASGWTSGSAVSGYRKSKMSLDISEDDEYWSPDEFFDENSEGSLKEKDVNNNIDIDDWDKTSNYRFDDA